MEFENKKDYLFINEKNKDIKLEKLVTNGTSNYGYKIGNLNFKNKFLESVDYIIRLLS